MSLKLYFLYFWYDRQMKTIMNIDKLSSITELQNFLDGSQAIAFTVLDTKQAKYSFIKKYL